MTTLHSTTDSFEVSVLINSNAADIWYQLTDTASMATWLGEPDMNIEVQTDWKINSPILIRGFHHTAFENKGVVVKFEPKKKLSYTHLSSLSRLADKTENYSLLDFVLTPIGNETLLTLTITNFPTEAIRKHLEFYWRTTLLTIQHTTEKQTA